jgi:hypothetical protein
MLVILYQYHISGSKDYVWYEYSWVYHEIIESEIEFILKLQLKTENIVGSSYI